MLDRLKIRGAGSGDLGGSLLCLWNLITVSTVPYSFHTLRFTTAYYIVLAQFTPHLGHCTNTYMHFEHLDSGRRGPGRSTMSRIAAPVSPTRLFQPKTSTAYGRYSGILDFRLDREHNIPTATSGRSNPSEHGQQTAKKARSSSLDIFTISAMIIQRYGSAQN